MAFGNATFANIGAAAQDIFSSQATAQQLRLKAHGDLVEAQNFDLASTLAKQNADFTEQSTAIKEMQTQRQILRGQGTAEADVAGSGFTLGGSALDILRAGAAEGALTKQVVGQQGLITEAGFNEQSEAYTNMAGAARFAASQEEQMASKAEKQGKIMAAIHGVAAVASLFTGGVGGGGGGGGIPFAPDDL